MDNLHFPLLALARLRMGTDGKGVTTLAAGAGCPLSCRYCINKRLLKEAPREDVTAEELIERIRIDDLYFRATGGGVTFGGGESLLHAAFIGLGNYARLNGGSPRRPASQCRGRVSCLCCLRWTNSLWTARI